MNEQRPIRAARAAPKVRAVGFDKGAFYRLCRMLHAYLSAFAFITLIFFAGTGVLLNHPDWIPSKARETERKLVVPAADLAAAQKTADPSAALARTVARMVPLVGAYRSGEVVDGEANLRFEGTKGSSTVVTDLKTGQTDVTVEHARGLAIIGDLHRGKNSGAAWRAVIDISGLLVLVLSVIGYVLFFSLRFRLRTSLILTVASLGVMAAIYLFFTV